MFIQIWKKIAEVAKYHTTDWVRKLDADAIFLPRRMRVWLKQNELVPPAGVYLENCKYVDYGYFGNLEVYSREAFTTLIRNIDTCKTSINWKLGVQNGKWGPMGEDLFAQACLDSVGVPTRPHALTHNNRRALHRSKRNVTLLCTKGCQ